MVRNFVTLVRAYADILRFWSSCKHKQCRRERHCRDRTGRCWNHRYPRTGPENARCRARIIKKRRALPLALRRWQRRVDPGDSLL